MPVGPFDAWETSPRGVIDYWRPLIEHAGSWHQVLDKGVLQTARRHYDPFTRYVLNVAYQDPAPERYQELARMKAQTSLADHSRYLEALRQAVIGLAAGESATEVFFRLHAICPDQEMPGQFSPDFPPDDGPLRVDRHQAFVELASALARLVSLARGNGLAALVRSADQWDDPFLAKFVPVVIEGRGPGEIDHLTRKQKIILLAELQTKLELVSEAVRGFVRRENWPDIHQRLDSFLPKTDAGAAA
ncbi:MAG: hypothetical protein KJ621_07330 [Proteobacteria bacterium]|nr:hypothetical protein [Pseudomonadota bacterium]MBU1740775.1 hypothetical protein [Pseudomonadota bacterium]